MDDYCSEVLGRPLHIEDDYFHLGGDHYRDEPCWIVIDLNVGDVRRPLAEVPVQHYKVARVEGAV